MSIKKIKIRENQQLVKLGREAAKSTSWKIFTPSIKQKQNVILSLDYKIEQRFSELDHELLKKHLTGHFKTAKIIRKGNKNMQWSGDQPIIDISSIEQFLKNAKSEGCTHLEIVYHNDRNTYYFFGIKSTICNDKEAKDIQKKINAKEKNILKTRIKHLKKELSNLAKELKMK